MFTEFCVGENLPAELQTILVLFALIATLHVCVCTCVYTVGSCIINLNSNIHVQRPTFYLEPTNA